MTALIAWLVSHEAVLAGLVVALVDFGISLNPAWKSNTIVEWVLSEAQSLLGSAPPPPPSAPAT
jgi:hypothetical protein